MKNEYKQIFMRLANLMDELNACLSEKQEIMNEIECHKSKGDLHLHENEFDARIDENFAHIKRVVDDIKKLRDCIDNKII